LIVSCDGMDLSCRRARKEPEGPLEASRRAAGVTPLVIEAGGALLAPGAFRAIAYDPRTGKGSVVRYGQGFQRARPVFGAGLVFICSVFELAARSSAGRRETAKSHYLDLQRGAPLTPSPLLAGSLRRQR
jgi:hypothetical protein